MENEQGSVSWGRTTPATAGNCLSPEIFKAFVTQLSHKRHSTVSVRPSASLPNGMKLSDHF